MRIRKWSFVGRGVHCGTHYDILQLPWPDRCFLCFALFVCLFVCLSVCVSFLFSLGGGCKNRANSWANMVWNSQRSNKKLLRNFIVMLNVNLLSQVYSRYSWCPSAIQYTVYVPRLYYEECIPRLLAEFTQCRNAQAWEVTWSLSMC